MSECKVEVFQIEKAVSCNVYIKCLPFSQETKITLGELLCSNWNEIDPDLLTLELKYKNHSLHEHVYKTNLWKELVHKGILRELLSTSDVVIFLLSGQTYWSKDIIFLVSDHEQIGLQAWLDGYHDINSECTYLYLEIEMPTDPEILKDIFVATTIGF